MARVNQNRDEGQTDPKELALEDIRGVVRLLITNSYGVVEWSKANEIGKNLLPTMAASTIIRFATGETSQPSVWTIRKMSELADYRPVFIPRGAKLPKGAIEMI